MKKLLLVALAVTVGALSFAQQTEQRTNSRIEPRYTDRRDAFYWGAAAATPSLPAPANPSIEFDGQETVILTWDAVPDAVGYEIFRDTTSPVPANYATHFASASTENRNVADFNSVLSDWNYVIYAVDSSGNLGTASTEVSNTDAHTESLQGVINGADARLGLADTAYIPGFINAGQSLDQKDLEDFIGNGGDADGQDDVNLTWVPWWDKAEPEVLYDNILGNGTFADATGWTLGSGWTISGGTLNIDGTNGTSATYTLASSTSDWVGTSIRVKYEVTTYTSGSGRNNIASENGASSSSAETRYDYYFISTTGSTDISFESTGSWNASIDNVEVDVINAGFGDSFYRSSNTNSASTIEDDTEIDWMTLTDWALEFRMSSADLTPGSGHLWWDNYGNGGGAADRSFEIGIFNTGQIFTSQSTDGNTQTQVTHGQPFFSHPGGNLWPEDGTDCFFFVRVEYDYDDGGGRTRQRVGISPSRNRGDGWSYFAWQDLYASAPIFDIVADGPIFLLSDQNGSSTQDSQMSGWELFNDLDESNTTPTYSTYAYNHEHDNAATGTNVTINQNTTDKPSMLITRPVAAFSDGHALNNGYTATYNDVEGRSFFNYAFVASNETGSDQPTVGYRLNGGSEIFAGWDSSGDFIGRIDDGTNVGTTTAYTMTLDRPSIMGYSVDTNTFYALVDGGGNNSSQSVDITSYSDMDTALASVTMGIARRQKGLYAMGSIPAAYDDFNDLLNSINIALPGRTGHDDAYLSTTVGSGPTPLTPTQKVKEWDSYFVRLNHYTGWLDKGIQEIELFTTPTLTGTPISRNTDIDQDTRSQFPAAMPYHFDYTDVDLTTNEWAWNEIIDGDTGTAYTPPGTGNYGGSLIGTGVGGFYVFLTNPEHIRSFQIKFDAATDTNTPARVTVYGWNRDSTGAPVELFREDVANGSSTYTFQNLQLEPLENIHEHPLLDL